MAYLSRRSSMKAVHAYPGMMISIFRVTLYMSMVKKTHNITKLAGVNPASFVIHKIMGQPHEVQTSHLKIWIFTSPSPNRRSSGKLRYFLSPLPGTMLLHRLITRRRYQVPPESS